MGRVIQKMKTKKSANKLFSNVVSYALAGILMLGGASELNANYINANLSKHTAKSQQTIDLPKQQKLKQIKDYVHLCNSIYEANLLLSCTFLSEGKYLSVTSDRQKARKYIKVLREVIQTAEKRIAEDTDHREYNEKVFYSSIALRNILEGICDENFMRIVGVNTDIENFNIIAYAKGVLKAENEA